MAAVKSQAATRPTEKSRSAYSQLRLSLFWMGRSRAALIGAVIVGFGVLVAIVGPYLAPHPYDQMNLSIRMMPPAWIQGGNWLYPLGTDDLGRDTLSRLIYSTRIVFIIGGSVTVFATALGVVLGLIAGYSRGVADTIIMRIVDVQWSFPIMILAVAVMAFLGTNFVNLLIVLTISNWVGYARTVRQVVLSLREEEYVAAATSIGASSFHIIIRHILPNLVAPLLVLATSNLANVVIMESSLSFLGLGVQPPDPSWGSMIALGRVHIYNAWWLVTIPGVALLILVLGVNQLGDGLRDLLDPRLRSIL